MAEEVGIVMSLYDRVSPTLKAIAGNTSAFDKNLDDLEQSLKAYDKAQDAMVKKSADLKKALAEADNQVKSAQKSYKKLNDEASKKALDEAIDQQAELRRALTETESNLRANSKAYDDLYEKARKAAKGIKETSAEVSKADNRAGASSGSSGVLSALGKAGLGQMAGDAALEIANSLIGSAAGDEMGGVLSSGLSGAISGAAMGSLAGPIGTAVGAAVGGAIGLAQGGTQAFEARDEAFKSYYGGLVEDVQQQSAEATEAGSATAAQRELDAIAFNRLLDGAGDAYLKDLRTLAADTPMEYSDLTDMSRALATGFGDSPERMLELMEAIGDAGSAVGVTAADMTEMSRAMSRMQSSGKATLEYLNTFQDRGVDVIGMLADAMGKTQGEIYDMISKSEISGQDAVSIIQAGMEEKYSGSMETMAQTFSGLTSTLEDTMTEIENAYGEGYNTERKGGLEAEIDAYGGLLGTAMQHLGEVSGSNQAYLENLGEQYKREALSAVLLGQGTTLYGTEANAELQRMAAEYREASAAYNAGDKEAGLAMERLAQEAEAMATAAYENSEQYQAVVDTELDLTASIRELTAMFDSWSNEYRIQQAGTKGYFGANVDLSEMSGAVGGMNSAAGYYESQRERAESRGSPNAFGLRRVPYDNYAALLHEGERVLTAREAREADRGGKVPSISITVSGNTFGAGMDEAAVAEAIAQAVSRKLQAGFQV